MFLDLKGNIYDYFNGFEDLSRKFIRFVGDPSERIIEDYLRILRYFRFYIRYGCLKSHDDATICAIRDNMEGLEKVSGERIWTELKKILAHPNSPSVIPMMLRDLGMAQYVGFDTKPENLNIQEFMNVQSNLFRESPPKFDPATLLSSFLSNDEDLVNVVMRLKLSNKQRDICMFILSNRDNKNIHVPSLQRKLASTKRPEQANLQLCMMEFLRYTGNYEALQALESWSIPIFPISGKELIPLVKKPKDMSILFDHLTKFWLDNNYTTDTELLMSEAQSFAKSMYPSKE